MRTLTTFIFASIAFFFLLNQWRLVKKSMPIVTTKVKRVPKVTSKVKKLTDEDLFKRIQVQRQRRLRKYCENFKNSTLYRFYVGKKFNGTVEFKGSRRSDSESIHFLLLYLHMYVNSLCVRIGKHLYGHSLI